MGVEVQAERAGEAVAVVLEQMQSLRSDTVSSEELEDIRAFMVGSFPLQSETPQQIASQIRAMQERTGTSVDAIKEITDKVAGISETAAAVPLGGIAE